MIARRLLGGGLAMLVLVLALPGAAGAAVFTAPTYSSPIVMSANQQLVWVVNPSADTVSVIRTRTNSVIRTIRVGDEPQSVAVDPNNRYAFVANAAASTVTAIRIFNANPNRFRAAVDRSVGRNGALTTGAEPWNIVASPDGRRMYVANSGQDTITEIDAVRRVLIRRIGRRIIRRVIPPRIIGHVNLQNSRCNDPDRSRTFQPRGLAVTRDSRRLFVTGFLAFTRPGGRQADDTGKQGVVCRLILNTRSPRIASTRPISRIPLAAQNTGFTVDRTGDTTPEPTFAFPNQMQSIVIRGSAAYVPNIAASPTGPLRFNVNTQAFLNVVSSVGGAPRDAGALNLHLGARDPEPGKRKLFFANPWAVAFTNQRGAGRAYVASAGSDLLVKLNVAGNGTPSFTGDENTTRYVDLNDPGNPRTAGGNAGKNPQGIVINSAGTRAYVMNFVSRNVSVVDLRTDSVLGAIRTAPLPRPGSFEERVHVGAEMFFSSRGNFNRPAGTTVSTTERLSSEGWQNCASCHFKGLTDGVIWAFGVGPRKSVPLNASFNPRNRNEQRAFNYSAIFDEVEDFELNIRNVSGPGALAAAQPCQTPPPAASAFDPNHGLLIGDNGNINVAPCTINAFLKPNANRAQLTVTPPGSGSAIPALGALRDWVAFAVRTPNAPLTRAGGRPGLSPTQVSQGRTLFGQACSACHGSALWTISRKAESPPPASEVPTEREPPPVFGNPVPNQYLNRVLRNIGSFGLGVPGAPNPIGLNVGGAEQASAPVNAAGVAGVAQDALGIDYNNDGRGTGYNVVSLLGIGLVQPYYHNGACETLACVLTDARHRTANGALPDRLAGDPQRAAVEAFVRSIGVRTPPFP